MKPNPYLIEQAAQALGTSPRRCALIGDQTTDVQAARAIGAASIGYANKPAKADDLTAAGADAVIATIDELTHAIRTSWARPINERRRARTSAVVTVSQCRRVRRRTGQ